MIKGNLYLTGFYIIGLALLQLPEMSHSKRVSLLAFKQFFVTQRLRRVADIKVSTSSSHVHQASVPEIEM
jgi:hypothetical protein